MNPFFRAWQVFYEIVGSASGALIGIQFVVIALIANVRRRADATTIDAFGTPTVVSFGGALALAAVMSAPWPSLGAVSVVLTICGVGGLAYEAIVFRRARRQTGYVPVAEDWVWYVILPSLVYAALTLAALLLRRTTEPALFVIGGTSVSLLLIGVRNAWDTVTHLVSTAPPDDAMRSS